jgi:hypothetical protein
MTNFASALHLNGQEHSPAGFSPDVADLPQPLAKGDFFILRHLQSGLGIDKKSAIELYRCRGLSAVISRLRKQPGLDRIETVRMRDENGEPYSVYKMIPSPAQTSEERTLYDVMTAPDPEEEPLPADPEVPVAASEPEPVPLAEAGEIRMLTVRWTPRGPELQIVPAGGQDDQPFLGITKPQARYLLENMRAILEAE